MIEIEVKSGQDPEALAELIAATLHGEVIADPQSTATMTGKLIREQQEEAERKRPSHDQIETVNFETIDDDLDWSEI